ncbi:hypothetical protein ID866_7059 [Astraeus odoratus]|nr:hypothetical protein ID866_7059 [Astraeus odoratus]
MFVSAFAKAYPLTVDETFAKHWDTWFTLDDLEALKDAGINTFRIPLGYWMVEALVERPVENYPRGGLQYLRRGLGWMRDAGIHVILDHHAAPGVQDPASEFAGDCTDNVEFYTPHNYHRALVWTAVMTALTHLDPQFSSVFSIEAVNEPIMDATKTPGYGQFQKNFVKTVRAIETVLGIPVPGYSTLHPTSFSSTNFTAALSEACAASLFDTEVVEALYEAIPILLDIGSECGLEDILTSMPFSSQRTPLVTSFMDVNWQYNNPSNPADAAIGPQGYDNHLYYSYASLSIWYSYLQRVQNDAILGNSPLWFGEWALPTEFNATDEFLKQWGDAQKLAYSQGAGWIFWNFKTEISNLTNGTALARQWSYLEALDLGLLTKDPAAYHNADVCEPYKDSSTSTTTSAIPSSTTNSTALETSLSPSTSPLSVPSVKSDKKLSRLVKRHGHLPNFSNGAKGFF